MSIGGYDEGETFYEEDEPVADVVAAFERGERFVTAPPDTACWQCGTPYDSGEDGCDACDA